METWLKRLWNGVVTFNLTMLLILNLFFLTMLVLGVVALLGWLAVRLGRVEFGDLLRPAAVMIVVFAACILLAVSVVVMIRQMILQPMRGMVAAMKRLAGGDFAVRMTCEGWMRPVELREFANAFNTAAEELGSTELLRKDFINNFSHEFKTPITSLGGFADLLLACGDEVPAAERQEYLAIISSESHRLAALATNVLALSRIESQTILTDTAAFDLTEQLRQTALMMEQKWAKKNITLLLETERDADVFYDGNAGLLKEVWMNVLDNACKFSPEGGAVTIGIEEQENRLCVTVRDTGSGMDKATQARIFDQFYQGDTSHKTEGNGLGLAMVKKVVELHKGTVRVVSELGQGSCFIIELPQ